MASYLIGLMFYFIKRENLISKDYAPLLKGQIVLLVPFGIYYQEANLPVMQSTIFGFIIALFVLGCLLEPI